MYYMFKKLKTRLITTNILCILFLVSITTNKNLKIHLTQLYHVFNLNKFKDFNILSTLYVLMWSQTAI